MEHNIITEIDEGRLDELMEYTPGYSEENSENIKRMFLQKATKKRKSPRRVALIACVAAAAIALSGAALAAAIGFDFGWIYNSFFNNPTAANRIEIGQSVEDSGMEITLLSAFTDGDMAYAMIEIKDHEGGRLSDSINVLSGTETHSVFWGATVYDEANNTVTLARTMYFANSVSLGDTVSLDISTIVSGLEYVENEILNFDVANYAVEASSISRDEWVDAVLLPDAPGSVGYSEDIDVTASEIRFLELNEIDVSIDGIDWMVFTNIGVIDGMLHIQYKRTDEYNGYYNSGSFKLFDGDGNEIPYAFDLQGGGYRETVYDTRDITDFGELKLAVSYYRADSVTSGSWNMSFVVEQELPKQRITVTPQDSPYYSEIEIACSPLATTINVTIARYAGQENVITQDMLDDDFEESVAGQREYIESFGEPYLTLEDGSTVTLLTGSSMFDRFIGSMDFTSVYFDIEQLRSITFCGEEYFFDSVS